MLSVKPRPRPLAEIFASPVHPPHHKCVLCDSYMQVVLDRPSPWAHCSNDSCAYTQNVVHSVVRAATVNNPVRCTCCYGLIADDQVAKVQEERLTFAHAD
eukprot:11742-Heterococcus_DN1.PRE.1